MPDSSDVGHGPSPAVGEGSTAATNGPIAPPRNTIGYVRWKIGYLSEDSFRGRLVEIIPHADGFNLNRLRLAFPLEVAAYEAWYHSPDGEFVLPVDPAGPRAEWTHPMCEDCWVTTQERGALPHRLVHPEAETCCWCGRPTSAGIYYRADSRRLAHHPEGGHRA